MKIGNLTIEKPLFLAPLAGITTRPFRLLSRKFGANFAFTEMISADAVFHEQEKTLKMIDFDKNEHPIGIQLFGAIPEYLAVAVKRVSEFGPDTIDLNFGCPVPKVIRKNGGAAILKNPGLAGELIDAAVKNSPVPVTIKIRSGWDANNDVYLEMGEIAQKYGAVAVIFHARSRSQNYSVRADWSKIAELKRSVDIPVVGNGDIETGEDARRMFDETGCDGVMIARAAMKNPFVFKQIREYLDNGIILPDMDFDQKIKLALEHSRMVVEYYGDEVGCKTMRKHLAWYTKGMPGGGELRRQLMQVSSLKDIESVLGAYSAN